MIVTYGVDLQGTTAETINDAVVYNSPMPALSLLELQLMISFRCKP